MFIRSHLGSRTNSVQVNIVAVSDHVFQMFPFDLLIQVSATQLSLFSCTPFVLMATDRASEDAMHTSLPGSPPLSSNVGSPHGPGHDLDGMGTRSGNTMDEKLDAFSHNLYTSKRRSLKFLLSRHGCPVWIPVSRKHWGFCDSTYRDGTEFQCPHRTYVQVRDICCLSIKCFRFGEILAYARRS